MILADRAVLTAVKDDDGVAVGRGTFGKIKLLSRDNGMDKGRSNFVGVNSHYVVKLIVMLSLLMLWSLI